MIMLQFDVHQDAGSMHSHLSQTGIRTVKEGVTGLQNGRFAQNLSANFDRDCPGK